MDEKVRQAILEKVRHEPFGQKFGLRVVELEDGYSRVEMVYTSDMENMLGIAHGGAIFALIDEAFEMASNSHGTVAVALNLSVTFIAPPLRGSKLVAVAQEINRTAKTANYEIKVTDAQDNLIATCLALVYRKGIPLPFLREEGGGGGRA